MTIQRRGPSASQETDLSRIQVWYNISDLCWGNCPSVVFPWSLTVLCNIDPTYAIRGSQGKAVSHWSFLVCFGQLRGPAYLSPDMENKPFSTRNGPRSDWAKLLLAQWVEETHESLLLSRPVWEHLPVLLQTQLFKLPHWQASSWLSFGIKWSNLECEVSKAFWLWCQGQGYLERREHNPTIGVMHCFVSG